jgi:hypothetical protein
MRVAIHTDGFVTYYLSPDSHRVRRVARTIGRDRVPDEYLIFFVPEHKGSYNMVPISGFVIEVGLFQ